MNTLSGATKADDHVVVTAVVADPRGACDAVQVLVAEGSIAAAVRKLRRAGYRKIGTRLGGMRLAPADVQVALSAVGRVFEREWLKAGEWMIVADPDGDAAGSVHTDGTADER